MSRASAAMPNTRASATTYYLVVLGVVCILSWQLQTAAESCPAATDATGAYARASIKGASSVLTDGRAENMSRFPRSRNAKITSTASWGSRDGRTARVSQPPMARCGLWLEDIDAEKDGTRERYMGGLGPTRNFKEAISLFC